MEHDSRHESPSLSSYLRVLRRRSWIVLLCAILVPATAYLLSSRQTEMYRSTAEVYLNKQNLASALTGIADQSLTGSEDRAANTQANLASVPDVARRALKIAGPKGMTAADLLLESNVASKGLSDILEFSVTDPDPRRAEALAGAYARAFTEYRADLDTRAIVRARREVADQLRALGAEGRERSQLYQSLTEKDQELSTLATLQTSRAYVIRGAAEATKVEPTPVRDAVLGLVLGVLLGVGLAFAIDALDTRVRTAGEVGDRLGLPLLARIPPPPKQLARDDRLVMAAQPSGTDAEAFRMLRTNLDFTTLTDEDVRTILVTSAIDKEGKSTTAANLAIAEARAGRRVALIDLDLRVPYLARFFGLQEAVGVTDVALGHASLPDALVRIDVSTGRASARPSAPPNGRPEEGLLDVLVAGPLPPDPGEFVGTRRLGDILAALSSRYDLVVIDTPPLLRVGDALTLSTYADAMLVVTRLNAIRRPMLTELRRLLGTAPARTLGFVVTGSRDRQTGYGRESYGYETPRADKPQRARRRRRAAIESARPADAVPEPMEQHAPPSIDIDAPNLAESRVEGSEKPAMQPPSTEPSPVDIDGEQLPESDAREPARISTTGNGDESALDRIARIMEQAARR